MAELSNNGGNYCDKFDHRKAVSSVLLAASKCWISFKILMLGISWLWKKKEIGFSFKQTN